MAVCVRRSLARVKKVVRGVRREVARAIKAVVDDGKAAAAAGHAKKEGGAPSEDGHLWMIVGLGNPGKRYAETRHNVGFRVVDAMRAELGAAEGEGRKEQGAVVYGPFDAAGLGGADAAPSAPARVLLVKPQTFMNLSGEAVLPLSRDYGIPPSRWLVVYDDLDLDVAELRLKAKGGHGGHNGMRSIIGENNDDGQFPRLRVGVSRPSSGVDVPDHVLGPFSAEEAALVARAVAAASSLVYDAVHGIGPNPFARKLKPADL